MSAIHVFKQADSRWHEMLIRSSLRYGSYGCVASTWHFLVATLLGKVMLPPEGLPVLRAYPFALVGPDGQKPGDLVSWPGACKGSGLVCDETVAAAADHDDKLHEFHTHLVDANADLAGTLAAAMVGGFAAVRVDNDDDGKGDHTIACVGRDGDGFLCADSAYGDTFTLDENLENAKRNYRATAVRAVYLP